MNSSINRNPNKILYISNCSDNTYRLIKSLANIKNESMNQICCDILFDFKGTPYIFADSRELFNLKNLLYHIYQSLDNIAEIDHKESHILNLAYKDSANKNFLETRQQVIKDNKNIIHKTTIQYTLINRVWNMFNAKQSSVTYINNVRKHLLKISKNIPIHLIHPKKPLHIITVSVPLRLYTLLKQICKIRNISFYALFSVALLNNTLLPHIIPSTNLLASLPKQKSAYQNNLIKNYKYYKIIKKSLHKIDNEDFNLYKNYKMQYHTFILLIKHLFSH